MNKNLKHLYRIFMWQKISPSLCLEFNEVLEADFVNNYYVVVLKDKFVELNYTVVVDNIKESVQVVINAHLNNKNYHTFKVSNMARLPLKLKKALNKRGLFKTEKDRSGYDGWTSIHRLVCSIRHNCKGLAIHHRDKNKGNNSCCNLVPVPDDVNNEIDYIYTTLGDRQRALNMGSELIAKLEKNIEEEQICKKKYLTDNDKVHMDLIKYSLHHPKKAVINKFKCFIKTIQTRRELFDYYFYKKEFIEWLKSYSSRLYSREYIDTLLI